MSGSSFSDLTPAFFLQTFVLELMHASEQQGKGNSEELIEHIARTAGRFFEEAYRDENNIKGSLDNERYANLILGLKNKIGGRFSLASSRPEGIKVINSCCPFGEGVTNFPELCRMTSSVFGGIAARNFGYAKVEISKSIARHDGGCEVCIYTSKEAAKNKPGLEYFPHEASAEAQLDMDELHSRIEESMQKIWNLRVKKQAKKQAPVIIAKSPAMQQVLQSIEMIAPTMATVLIKGETGVGKELIARAIHAMSDRSSKPFMAINCGAIPESLIESALFGHEKGAFTGAVEVHQGFFERAEGGTLFLDEVDSLSPAAQTRLLRVLQEGELERVGGKQTIEVDVRIISATHQELQELVAQKQFRNDLYYRINVVRLLVPRLAERSEDFSYLVQLILQRLNKRYNKQVDSVSREVMQQIRSYHWPGNVRELENTLERSLLYTKGNVITRIELEQSTEQPGFENWKALKQRSLAKTEQEFLQEALKKYHGDVKKVAQAMQLTPRAVYGKLKKYQLVLGEYRLT